MPRQRVTARNLPTKEAAPPLTGEPPIRYGRDTGVIGVELEQGGEWEALFAHATSTGASHSYLNQSVTTGASPTFKDLTVTTPVSIYALSHDSFADFAAAKHFLQTAIDHVSTGLATGLLKVTTGTGALGSITDNSANWDLAVAHIAATGSSHSYIDQAVTTAGTPQFAKVGLGAAAGTAMLTFLAATAAAGGIDFGGDVTLYRSAANVLKTDDSFHIGGGTLNLTGGNSTIQNTSGWLKLEGIAKTFINYDNPTIGVQVGKTGNSLAMDVFGVVDAKGGFEDNGVAGIDTTFVDADGNTITVSGGIITAKTAP
jgi:hypothetical protein